MAGIRKRKSASDRKAEIVETAIRLAGEVGPDRVTTQLLADEVGVTQPAIFRHFATKSEIWVAVSDYIDLSLSAYPEVSETDDIVTAIVTVLKEHFEKIAKQPAIPSIIFSRELHSEISAFHERLSSTTQTRKEKLALLISRAQEEGTFSTYLDADVMAELVFDTIAGISVRWVNQGRAFDLPEEGVRHIKGLLDRFRVEKD